MRSILLFVFILGKKIMNKDYKTFALLIIWIGCINVASADQCYACDSSSKSTCGDPFDANSMATGDKIEAPPGGACLVCFMRNDSCFYVHNS